MKSMTCLKILQVYYGLSILQKAVLSTHAAFWSSTVKQLGFVSCTMKQDLGLNPKPFTDLEDISALAGEVIAFS